MKIYKTSKGSYFVEEKWHMNKKEAKKYRKELLTEFSKVEMKPIQHWNSDFGGMGEYVDYEGWYFQIFLDK